PELTMAQALRTPQFAAIALTYFACCAAHSGPIFHMVTHAIDHGVPAMAAATVLSVASLASLSGKIVCGLVADRVGATRTLVAGLALQAVAVSLYVFTRDLASFYALAVMFGFAYGGVMPLYAILVREYFGARIMGTTFGAVAFVSTLGMALGPWAGGWLYDAFGSYFWLFSGSFGQLIQRSNDGGKTWEAVGNKFVYDGVPGTHLWYDGTSRPWEFARVWYLEPSLTDPDMVYAGVQDAALFRSMDGGQTWQE